MSDTDKCMSDVTAKMQTIKLEFQDKLNVVLQSDSSYKHIYHINQIQILVQRGNCN